MGQKVNPISNRLGIVRGWDSNWYGGKNFGDSLLEDSKLRKYLNVRLAKASVSRIVIERTLKLVTITICTARPGVVIGKGGQDVDKLKEELKKITDKDIQINIFEIKRPELDAVIVANNIARQVEGKIAYRRAIKMAIANTMRMGAEGIKVQISGRLNGAEMARSEMYKEGRTPLVPNHCLTFNNVGMSFPISRMSSTYNIRNTTMLPLVFLYTQGSSSFLRKPNSLTVSSKRRFQLRDACFNP